MKKNVIIFCVFAALAMLFASCSGGGGGSTLNNLLTSVEGAWLEETAQSGVYSGFYLQDGKVYPAATKDKSTIYYTKDTLGEVAPGTYTSSGEEVKITYDGKTATCKRNGDTMTYTESGTTHTMKKHSGTIEAKTAAEFEALMLSWILNP
ncbi:MAG: hypothetical protein MJ196_07855 [Treponemataceae bacterium]|nr:hypothetical protein [Treponemataceae bacterium]